MATVEKNTLLCTKDTTGNLVITYPITKIENVDGLQESLNGKSEKLSRVDYVLAASKWSGNTYSFEAEYPFAAYELEVAIGSASSEQYDAFCEAKPIGSATSNVITALGNVPTIDIPVILEVIKK